jgi:hypothetical protein
MKKLIVLLLLFTSCEVTTPSEDMENLQKQYDVVYRISNHQYIVIDSIGTYEVRVENDGTPYSKVKIK